VVGVTEAQHHEWTDRLAYRHAGGEWKNPNVDIRARTDICQVAHLGTHHLGATNDTPKRSLVDYELQSGWPNPTSDE
jgi:hypothetical protein